MPIHDWSRIEAEIFHDFHLVWIGQLQQALNDGLLPSGYYALAEQHAGELIADVLTLHTDAAPSPPLPPLPRDSGGLAVAEAPPRVGRKQLIEPFALARRRTLAIRHVSGHRLVALLEIVSPANKDRAGHVEDFIAKAASALERGIHLLLVDLFPPGSCDPQGLHGALLEWFEASAEPYDLPDNRPLTVASYAASPRIEAYLNHLALGVPLPDMPLFLQPDRYIPASLETTYAAAFRGMPACWREVLTEGQ